MMMKTFISEQSATTTNHPRSQATKLPRDPHPPPKPRLPEANQAWLASAYTCLSPSCRCQPCSAVAPWCLDLTHPSPPPPPPMDLVTLSRQTSWGVGVWRVSGVYLS
ncbi:hypothetical protein NHX12_017495, partial [Muraenolepis orangiensis]